MNIGWRRVALALPWIWLGLFFLLPLALIAKISLSQMQVGVPPYTPLFAAGEDGIQHLAATFQNYRDIFSDSLYLKAYLGSLRIAFISTVIALLVGYP